MSNTSHTPLSISHHLPNILSLTNPDTIISISVFSVINYSSYSYIIELMGLGTKQVSGDQGVEWGQAFVQSTAATRRQAESLKCPRCASTNTKFCYYNNYNKSQPRHFCKSCKRHWTKGGTLRNVPVGGARKNKRPKPSKSPAAPPPAHKNMSNMLYHALIGRSPSHETKPIDNAPFASIPNTEFQFSTFTTFDVNPSSYQPLNAFDHFAGNLDSVEESTITSVNIPGCSSGAMDLPNYWSWNDVDVLTSGDLSLSWDDEDKAMIKP